MSLKCIHTLYRNTTKQTVNGRRCFTKNSLKRVLWKGHKIKKVVRIVHISSAAHNNIPLSPNNPICSTYSKSWSQIFVSYIQCYNMCVQYNIQLNQTAKGCQRCVTTELILEWTKYRQNNLDRYPKRNQSFKTSKMYY